MWYATQMRLNVADSTFVDKYIIVAFLALFAQVLLSLSPTGLGDSEVGFQFSAWFAENRHTINLVIAGAWLGLHIIMLILGCFGKLEMIFCDTWETVIRTNRTIDSKESQNNKRHNAVSDTTYHPWGTTSGTPDGSSSRLTRRGSEDNWRNKPRQQRHGTLSE